MDGSLHWTAPKERHSEHGTPEDWTTSSSKKLHVQQIFSFEKLDALQVLWGWLAGHLDQKIFLRRIGLLLYSRSDPFPLTVPRWRWGIRILQGKGSLPLGNNPRPGGSIKILSWAPIGSSSLKTTSELLIVHFIPTIIIFPKSSARSKKSERTKGRLICLTLAF